MKTYRLERANDFIKEELTLLLMDTVRDPRLRVLSITGVDLTADRRIARVYVSCYSGEEDLQEALPGLESAKGFLRSHLSHVLSWRFTPELEFRVDRSWQRGEKIESILGQIAEEHKERDDESE